MIRISKSVFAVGGVVIAAGLITFTNPKAVHAVAAALVEVTNTATNPVVTQGIGQQAGEIVNLECPSNGQACFAITSTTGNLTVGTPFQVPAGKSFVVTSVDITINPIDSGCTGLRNFFLLGDNNGAPFEFFARRWLLEPNQNYHFAYPTGIVFASTSYIILQDTNGCYSQYPAFDDLIYLQGYLTAS
jgi:hypothetical protein